MKITRLAGPHAWAIEDVDARVLIEPGAADRVSAPPGSPAIAVLPTTRRDVYARAPGATFDVGGLRVQAIASGFPFARQALGYVIESRTTGATIYVESHVVDEGALGAVPTGVDVFIGTCAAMGAGPIPRTMDAEWSARVVARLRARRFVPTGTFDPAELENLRRLLVARRMPTELVVARPGDALTLT